MFIFYTKYEKGTNCCESEMYNYEKWNACDRIEQEIGLMQCSLYTRNVKCISIEVYSVRNICSVCFERYIHDKDRRFITPSVQLFSMNSLFSSQIRFRNFKGRKKHSPCMVFAQLELYKSYFASHRC